MSSILTKIIHIISRYNKNERHDYKMIINSSGNVRDINYIFYNESLIYEVEILLMKNFESNNNAIWSIDDLKNIIHMHYSYMDIIEKFIEKNFIIKNYYKSLADKNHWHNRYNRPTNCDCWQSVTYPASIDNFHAHPSTFSKLKNPTIKIKERFARLCPELLGTVNMKDKIHTHEYYVWTAMVSLLTHEMRNMINHDWEKDCEIVWCIVAYKYNTNINSKKLLKFMGKKVVELEKRIEFNEIKEEKKIKRQNNAGKNNNTGKYNEIQNSNEKSNNPKTNHDEILLEKTLQLIYNAPKWVHIVHCAFN